MKDEITALVIVLAWIAGVALAHGVWSTVAAIFVPFYAWYLVVERLMAAWGWL